jgi:thiamine-monophosphate kinase
LRRNHARSASAARRGGHLSEDSLIARLRDLIESHPGNARVLSSIGDDAAVWQPSRSHRSVITTDALVAGVHFRREMMPARDIGWRAMAANLSDLAAMGARPVLATVALGIASCAADEIFDLYRGMLEIASRHGCAIAGGDVTRAPVLTIAITAIGEARPSRVKGRSGARPGDIAAVTGPLGASRAGLHLAANADVLPPDLRAEALRAHGRPEPRVGEGRWLAASAHVRAMMDISDGLSTDLRRMCERSGCAALVQTVPVAASAAVMANARGEDARAYALAGGEDFELLAAVAPRAFAYLRGQFAKHFKRELYAVGRFREGSGLFIEGASGEEPLPSTGWDHLQ